MPLVDQMTDKRVADSIRRRADERFHEAIKALSQFRFVDLVVEAETVHLLKTIPCLLTNPHCLSSPVLLDLWENRSFNKQDYIELFGNLIQRVDSYEPIPCASIIDKPPAQSSGLDELLWATNFPIPHPKCFTHMSNLVLTDSSPTSPGSEVMSILTDVQCLVQTTEATTEIGRRCTRFIQTRWPHMTDTLAFVCGSVGAITSYDETMGTLCQMIISTTADIVPGEPAADAFDDEGLTDEANEDSIVVETYEQAVANFATLSDEERMAEDPCTAPYGLASK